MATGEIIALVLQYGIKYGPSVGAMVASWFSGMPGLPTAEQWAAFFAQCDIRSRDQMNEVLGILKIDPNSDKGKALLSLTPA